MLAKFLSWITTTLGRFGYANVLAKILAGFLITIMVVIVVLMGLVRVMQDKGREHVAGSVTGYCGQTGMVARPALFDIQR